jgi:GWxTD domain-containing protein
MREAESNPYKASFNLTYNLVPSFEITTVLDSNSFSFSDEEIQPPQKALMGSFDVKTPPTTDKNYVLQVSMTDLNRQISFENFLRMDKGHSNTHQNFLLTDTVDNVIYKNHIPRNVPFKIKYNRGNTPRFFVSFYKRDFPVALPPYSSAAPESFELNPDTTFLVGADQIIRFNQNGFYHFRLDTNSWDGFTVYSFYDAFPYIAKRDHLGPPLRYLTTKREYDKLLEVKGESQKTKSTADEFWLDRAGSIERSKILVSSYYSRVQEANMFFSSYLEGWKTDRGIIYVVYGPPDKVYRSSAGEAWVYGEETSSLSYYFNFLKVSNPFSDNDYSLNRMNGYRYGWGQAIESWRNGRIYNSKDIKREQDESDQNNYRQRLPYRY